MATKRQKSEVLLTQDALGKLYAIPIDLVEEFRLSDKDAKRLVKATQNTGSKLKQELDKVGIVRKLSDEELPNFRLLMQTEYKQSPEQ